MIKRNLISDLLRNRLNDKLAIECFIQYLNKIVYLNNISLIKTNIYYLTFCGLARYL